MARRTVLRDCPTYQRAKSSAPDAFSSVDFVSHYVGSCLEEDLGWELHIPVGLQCQDLVRLLGGPPGEGGRATAAPATEDPGAAGTSHREGEWDDRALQLSCSVCMVSSLRRLRCPRSSSLLPVLAPMGSTGSQRPSEALFGKRALCSGLLEGIKSSCGGSAQR